MCVWTACPVLIFFFYLFFFLTSSTASNSPRSTPGSSPSLRRRVLGGSRANEGEVGGEKSSGGGGGCSDSPLPSIPSASSLSSAYPLAARHFTRNAKVTDGLLNMLCSGVILKITTNKTFCIDIYYNVKALLLGLISIEIFNNKAFK